MRSDFGKKDGTSATAGKSAEIIRSPSTGVTRRVFRGQRLLVISQKDEDSPLHVDPASSRELAERGNNYLYDQGYQVHYIETAELVSA